MLKGLALPKTAHTHLPDYTVDTPAAQFAARAKASLRLYTVVAGEAEVMPLFIGHDAERTFHETAREEFQDALERPIVELPADIQATSEVLTGDVVEVLAELDGGRGRRALLRVPAVRAVAPGPAGRRFLPAGPAAAQPADRRAACRGRPAREHGTPVLAVTDATVPQRSRNYRDGRLPLPVYGSVFSSPSTVDWASTTLSSNSSRLVPLQPSPAPLASRIVAGSRTANG